jgi:hypothetical protein
MNGSLFDLGNAAAAPAPARKAAHPPSHYGDDVLRVIQSKYGPFHWLDGGESKRDHVVVETREGYRIRFVDDGSDGGPLRWDEDAISRNLRVGMWEVVR